MFARSFPSYKFPNPSWHRVHPLDLVHAACNPSIVVNAAKARDEVPDYGNYCRVCEMRERFVAKFSHPRR